MLQTPSSVRKEGGRCSRCWIWGSSPANGEWWSMLFLCGSWKNTVEISMLLSVKDLLEGSCNPWSIHAGAGSWQKLWPVRDPCWTSPFLTGCTPWIGHILQELQPIGRTDVEDVCRVSSHVSHGRKLMPEHGKTVMRNEWQKWSVINWLQPPLLIPLCYLEWKEVKNIWMKLNLERSL